MIIDRKSMEKWPAFYSGYSEEPGKTLQAAYDEYHPVDSRSTNFRFWISIFDALIGLVAIGCGAPVLIGAAVTLLGVLVLVHTVQTSKRAACERTHIYELEARAGGQLHTFGYSDRKTSGWDILWTMIASGMSVRGRSIPWDPDDFKEHRAFIERNEALILRVVQDIDTRLAAVPTRGSSSEAQHDLRTALRQRIQPIADIIVKREVYRLEQLEAVEVYRLEQLEAVEDARLRTIAAGIRQTAAIERAELPALSAS